MPDWLIFPPCYGMMKKVLIKAEKEETMKKQVKNILIGVVAAAVFVGLGIFLYRDQKAHETAKEAQKQQKEIVKKEEVEVADGESYDYEKAGFIELADYEKIPVEITVGEEVLYEEMISHVKKDYLSTPVESGDVVLVDYSGSQDQVVLPDLAQSDAYVKVGQGEYVDGFEDGMLGMKKGETREINVTFPEDYQVDPSLAGENVVFSITCKKYFNKQCLSHVAKGNYATIPDYEGYLKEKLEKENRESKGESAFETLKEDSKLKTLPESLYQMGVEDNDQSYSAMADLYGTSKEEVLESLGMDTNAIADMAQDWTFEIMLAKTIAIRENLTLTDEFYKNFLMEELEYQEGDAEATVENMEKEYQDGSGSRPKDDALVEMVKEYVGEHSEEI